MSKEHVNIIKKFDFFQLELETIVYIHFDAKYYFKDVEYLNNPKTLGETRASVSLLVRRIRIAFWRLGIIEVSKLFQKSRNQHFNLIDFILNLEANYGQYRWLKDLPKTKLTEWINKFKTDELIYLGKRISIQRDNYFAHTDKEPEVELKDSKITFKEINELIEFTEEIIITLKRYCFETHIDLDIDDMGDAGNLLNIISFYNSNFEKNQNERLKKYFKEKNNGA